MALVFNATVEKVKVQALGNYFEFAPGQIKNFNDNISHFLTTNKAYLGLVGIADSVVEDPNSEESKALKAEAQRNGIRRRIEHLDRIIKNNEISLQNDLNIKGMDVKSSTFMSDGELEALRERVKYTKLEQDEQDQKMKEIEELKGKLISGVTE